MGIIAEFKEFALKGNMIDVPVGVVIGAAVGTIVKSLVDDVIMPPLGLITGGIYFADKKIHFKDAVIDPNTKAVIKPALDLRYGVFINNIVTFLIIAVSIFFVIKLINMARRKPEPEPQTPPALTKDQELLQEIRDLLAARQSP